MATEWVEAQNIEAGDRVNTTNGMREVLYAYPGRTGERCIIIQDSGSSIGETTLYRSPHQKIERQVRNG